MIQSGKETVAVAVTTHLAAHQVSLADHHVEVASLAEMQAELASLPSGLVLFTGSRTSRDRLGAVPGEALEALREACTRRKLHLLLEADGSNLRPLKAPRAHEPALPPWVNRVIVVAGLVGLGKPLDAEWVFQPEIFAALSGLDLREPVTAEAIVRVLTHKEGGLKAIPESARRAVLLTGAYTPSLQAAGGRIAAGLTGVYDAAVVAEVHDPPPEGEVLAVYEGEAAIVLAAGASDRMGSPKQLLDWQGEPFVHKVARTALGAGCSPVVVVIGSNAEAVAAAVADLPVQIAHNPDWTTGQSSSLQTGLRALPPNTGCALFLLVDQPQISLALISSLLERHRTSLSPVTAPLVDGQRANPILFDRVTFPALLDLSGDTGGRAVLSRFRVDWLSWHDVRQLLDVDTPEDYNRLLGSA